MADLAEIAADLRRNADAMVLDVVALARDGAEPFRQRARHILGDFIEIRGVRVRLQFTRDRIGSRDAYHLSIGAGRDRLEPNDIKAILAAFFPDGNAMQFSSTLGNCWQFLGAPFENGGSG